MIRGVIGTAGHIDHGKTALVRALTGVDTDRLPEEKRRGITIDLGFTHLDLDGASLGVVDVPGHEDFVRNMVAGAAGIDLLLMVVAADEGVMPQTREHLAIAQLLGVPRAVVALTKADLVDDDFLELAADDVAALLDGTPFSDAPVIRTSATTGRGLTALTAAIAGAVGQGRGGEDDLFRLPVDRAFTVRGTGTVITGTVWSGTLGRDDQARILPGGLTARVRGMEVHGTPAERVAAGHRAAVALAGLERGDVPRGTTLIADPAWQPSSRLTVRLAVLPATDWSIEHGQRVRVHLGTAEVMARAFLLDGALLAPGETGWAELRLEAPLVARARDRVVVRSYSPVTTIAGGVVAEPFPPARSRSRRGQAIGTFAALLGEDPTAALASLLGDADVAGAPVATLPHVTGLPPTRVEQVLDGIGAVRAGDRAFAAAAARRVSTALSEAADHHHRHWPIRTGIEAGELRRAAPGGSDEALVAHVLASLIEAGELVMRQGHVARPHHTPTLSPDHEAARDRVLGAYADAGAQPPRTAELRQTLSDIADFDDLLALLEARQAIVRMEHDLFIHRDTIEDVAATIRDRFAGREDLSPAEVRDLLGISRRHLIPILEHLDRTGVTRRLGEGRVVIPA